MSKSRTTKRLAEARTFRNFFLSGDDSHSSDKKPNNRPKLKDGGARRDRTDDLKLAKLALSQLSYGPVVSMFQLFGQRALAAREKMVGLGRLELPTSRLSSARSNQLSYRPGRPAACRQCLRLNSSYERDTKTAIRRSSICHSSVGTDGMAIARSSQIAPETSLKGGDPAAGSPTATLLRLHPSR